MEQEVEGYLPSVGGEDTGKVLEGGETHHECGARAEELTTDRVKLKLAEIARHPRYGFSSGNQQSAPCFLR